MSYKSRINLLQAELIPVKHYLTLTTVVLLWALLLLAMVVLASFKTIENNKIEQQHSSIRQLNKTQKKTLEEMQQLLVERREDPQLQAELDKLKFILKYKNQLKERLSQDTSKPITQFATVMSEMAEYHHPDIQLLNAHYSRDNVSLSGLSKHAESVPHWLTNFENASFLSGQQFAEFSLTQQENKAILFHVSAQPQGEQP